MKQLLKHLDEYGPLYAILAIHAALALMVHETFRLIGK